MTKGFYNIVEQSRADIPKFIEITTTLLEKEDSKLYKHLLDIKVIQILPFLSWFESCFAGIINEQALAKYILKNIFKLVLIFFLSIEFGINFVEVLSKY